MNELIAGIPRNCRYTFAGAMIAGLTAHLFNFTNVLKNYDSIVLNGYGAGIYSGRWFLNLIGDLTGEIWGVYNVPFFNGIVSLMLLAAAACVVTRMFDVRDTMLAALWGGVFVVFPAVTGMMFFLFTSVFYSLAVLMTVTAAWMTHRYRFGFLPAAVLSGSAIGIYQAYFPLMAGLLLSMLILECLQKEKQWKTILIRALRFLASLVLSLVFYFVMLRFMLDHVYHTQLGGYQGIDQSGSITLHELGPMLKRTYSEFLRLPLQDSYGISQSGIIRASIMLLGITCIVIALNKIVRGRIWKQPLKMLFLVIFTVIYPAAVHSVVLMCYQSHIYTIMVYGAVVIYLMPIILVQHLPENGEMAEIKKKNTTGKAARFVRNMVGAVILLVVVNYTWQANGNYTAMYYTNQQAYEYWNSMVTRIQAAKGYHNRLKWVFLGDDISDPLYQNRWAETAFQFGGSTRDFDGKDLINAYSRKGFISQILGVQIQEAPLEVAKKLEKKKKFRKMPCYPADGSIMVYKDKYVVIKLEWYVPES